jgi:1-acyl-sn-glycerol-3-phosphate acyltransferase
MRTLYSIAFWTFIAVSSAIMFVLALAIFAVTFPFDKNRRVLHLFTCFWAMLYFYVNPLWRVRVEHRERLPWSGSAILVANHQSLGDILVLFALYRPFKWVSKASVFKVPFIGWNMALNGYVPLVRGNKGSAAKMFAACARWLDREMPILMFPEGTRSPDGNLLPFKDGAFRLAIDKGCPVIPIVLTGTARTLPKHGFVLDSRADCVVRVLPAISPAAFAGDTAALRDHVRDVMRSEIERIGSPVQIAQGGGRRIAAERVVG